jgi:phosphoglycolate phosphatase
MSSNFKVQSPKPEKPLRVPHSEIRILLWDIDGTLLTAQRGGAYKDYFAPAMEKIYGSSGVLREQLQVSGMTDLQIAFEALQPEGFTVEQIYDKNVEFSRAIGEEIERICAGVENRFVALPGAREVLEATQKNPRFVNALLTGNLPLAAEFKLKFVRLNEFFDCSLGAFGNESHRRIDLPAVAARNVSAKFDYEFEPSQFIVVGDTPNDIACARHFGAKAVAVATGRNHPADTLMPCKPDYLFENLIDTNQVLRVLENL